MRGGLVKTEFIVLSHPPCDRRSIHRPLDKGESVSVIEDAVFCGNGGKTMRPRRDVRRCELGEVIVGSGGPGDHRAARAVGRPLFTTDFRCEVTITATRTSPRGSGPCSGLGRWRGWAGGGVLV
jgi:hypothetical protein